ncbi:MAG TPA: HPr family phosphocarrier protein [Dongiaceae bacterium]|jgi:phosphocarrier protein|nr:HPr family phosphocarrier protein [Dongiaceae bacterium]
MKVAAHHDGKLPAATASAQLVNAVGLHARPSVKLIAAAKAFGCRVEVALDPAGPWVDAKSPVKIMRLRARKGAVLYIRALGHGAEEAVAALVRLVSGRFGEAADAGHA